MKRCAGCLGLALAMTGAIPLLASDREVCTEKPPSCEPGFRYVPVTELREVEHPVCKVVPAKRTKWVYSSKPDYYCLPACPCPCLHHKDSPCDACKHCEGPYCRQQLLKKQVEWECGTKCVVEVLKEKVPCTVWRKVPCGVPGCSTGPLPPAPTPVTGAARHAGIPAAK